MAGPILWGGNNTANNLQTFVTTDSIGRNSVSGKNYLSSFYFFNTDPTSNIVTTLTSTGNRATNTQYWGSSTTSLLSYVTVSYLRSPGSAQMTLVGTASAQFVETPMFTLDVADAGAMVAVGFDYATVGTFAPGDCDIVIMHYNSSGTYIETIVPSVSKLPASLSQFQTTFLGSNTSTDQYSIRFRSQNAASRVFVIDSLKVSPNVLAVGTPISPWISYTPSFTGIGTPADLSMFWRRVGDSMEIQGSFQTGTVTGALVTMSLYNNLNIDATKIGDNTAVSTTSNCPVFGDYQFAGVNGGAALILGAPATNSAVVYFGNSVAVTSARTPQTGTGFFANNIFTYVNFITPISQWGTQTTLASSQAEFEYNTSTNDAADTTSFGYGAAGGPVPGALTAARLKRVQFNTPIQPTDNIQIEVQSAGNSAWIPLDNYNASATICPLQLQNGVSYGIGTSNVASSSNQLDIEFGQYAYPNGLTYSAAGLSWASVTAGTRYRVRKSSGVGVGELVPATQTSAGYMPRYCDWTSYTATATFGGLGTVTNAGVFYKVVGNSLFVRASCTTGTVAASLATLSVPSAFTINGTDIPFNTTTSNALSIVGQYQGDNSGQWGNILVAPGSSTSQVYFSGTASGGSGLRATNGSGLIGSSTNVSLQFEVPIN